MLAVHWELYQILHPIWKVVLNWFLHTVIQMVHCRVSMVGGWMRLRMTVEKCPYWDGHHLLVISRKKILAIESHLDLEPSMTYQMKNPGHLDCFCSSECQMVEMVQSH